jgi:hypothetical protein
MRTLPLPSLRRSSLSWLVWLALLLPLAQCASAVHGYRHIAQQTKPDQGGQQPSHSLHCDLCLAAADLTAGGVPTVLPGSLFSALRHVLPRPRGVSTRRAPTTLAYRSRAPPLTQP